MDAEGVRAPCRAAPLPQLLFLDHANARTLKAQNEPRALVYIEHLR